MKAEIVLHSFFLLIAVGIASTIVFFSARRRNEPGAISLIVFAVALLIWAASDLLFHLGHPPFNRFWLGFTYFSATVVSTVMLTFAMEYTERSYYLNRRVLALLAIEPALTLMLYMIDYSRGNIFLETGIHKIGAAFLVSPWLLTNMLYDFSLVLVSIVLILDTFSNRLGAYRPQSGAILTGLLIPILAIFATGFIQTYDLMLVAFALTGGFFTYSLFKHGLFALVNIPRWVVVEGLEDGWMVLDKQNRILDMNPAAEKLMDLPRRELYGRPVENYLSGWPNLKISLVDSSSVLDEVRSVLVQGERKFFNLHVHSLTDNNGKMIGHIVLWHDNTEHRKAEEARLRARDELFVLLRSIYGAASRAQGWEDFLAAAVYQIVYTFQSQVCVIFLKEKSLSESGTDSLLLAAHHGISTESVDRMYSINLSSLPKENNMVSWVFEHQEALLIEDVRTDPRVFEPMDRLGAVTLLVVPLLADGNVIGLICLAREKKRVYRTDEIARLNYLADEIATFIHGDRRRQLGAILAERQRVVRDLHDSVTQNLAGLVAMSEATKASYRGNSSDVLIENLTLIRDTARQALKEMRLYLFEMSPIDLEKEGLIAILQQRLLIVEGHVDVETSLEADDGINLPMDISVQLYHIAQEALNNTLKHANAKLITIRFKQDREKVIMAIADNGRGFNPKEEVEKGLGLRHMRERAARIGATFKINSAIGKGTKITVTLSRKGKRL
jgi:PAS domain S-box-containing protein